MYVRLDNNTPVEWPVFATAIKKANPNVSFPSNMSNVDPSKYGFAKFKTTSQPTYNSEYEVIQELTPVLVGDTYVQTWKVVDKYTAEERAAYDAQKEAERLERLPAEIRSRRQGLLEKTDWWALSDVGMTEAQAAYRQALRDVPEQAGFPWDVTWPEQPE